MATTRNAWQRSIAVLSLCLFATLAHAASYQYFRVGNSQNSNAAPLPGTALMGGGKDLDEAFRWLCHKGNGGDFLILRASGGDDYNPYVNGLCQVNSVATLIIPDRQTARDPAVATTIRSAAVVFLSGGDQARYIRDWKGTPVQDALNAHIAAGKPIGGTSAGLAILGEFAYGALNDRPDDSDLTSKAVLANPYVERVTLVRGFISLPNLKKLLADSHFAKRDRMGRSLGFLARVMRDGWSGSPRELAIDESSAFLLEPDGRGTVVGNGMGAYFIRPTQKPTMCQRGEPLSFGKISVYKVPAGGYFDLTSWTGEGGTAYVLTVRNGKLDSTQPGHAIY